MIGSTKGKISATRNFGVLCMTFLEEFATTSSTTKVLHGEFWSISINMEGEFLTETKLSGISTYVDLER